MASSPPVGIVAIRVDASIRDCGTKVGCGGAIRDHHGNFVIGFAQKLDLCSVLEAELWDLFYHGLSLAWGKGMRKIVFDSSAALDLIADNYAAHLSLSLTHTLLMALGA